MRWILFGLAPAMVALSPLLGRAELMRCVELSSEGTLNVTGSFTVDAEIRDGTVQTVRIGTANSLGSVSELHLVAPGISQRLAIFPDPQTPGAYRSVSNLAVVEADGAVTLSTLSASTSAPTAPPMTRVTRLRCPR